jgi:hypothetical protein
MTGVATKPTYLIKTPTASITVRGTIFDLYVQDSGMTWLLLHEGSVEVCNADNVCKVHDKPGKLIRITPKGTVGKPINWDGLPGKSAVPFDEAFPFVGTPVEIDPKPIFTREAILNLDVETPPVRKPKRASTDDDEPPVKVKRKHNDDDDEDKPQRVKTARKSHGDDDDWGNGIKGMDIVIGGGIGFGGGHRMRGGDGPPMRNNNIGR